MAVATDPDRQQSESIAAHRRMIELVRTRDGERAQHFWSKHMEKVSDRLIDSLVDTSITELAD